MLAVSTPSFEIPLQKKVVYKYIIHNAVAMRRCAYILPTYTYFTSRVPSTDIVCICCLFSDRPPLILMAFFQKMMLEFFRAIILDDALKRNGEKEGHRRLGTLRQKCCVYSLTFNCRNLFFWIRDKDDDVAASICIGTFIYNTCMVSKPVVAVNKFLRQKRQLQHI